MDVCTLPDNAEIEAYKKAEEYFFGPEMQMHQNLNPHIFFVFSSPGAGKTTAVKPLIVERFCTYPPVILEIDELKSFIPQGIDIDKTAEKWFKSFVARALSEKRNLIIFRQRNMLQPNQTFHIYRKAKNCGYTTHADIVALDMVRSRLGMIHRYEFALDKIYANEKEKREQYPRKPDFIKHYIFYKTLPIITSLCCRSDDVDVVEVFDRERNRIAWLNKKTQEKSSLSPLKALVKERTRQWANWEKEKFKLRCQQAKEKMRRHKRSVLDFIKFKFLTKTTKSQ